MAQTNVGTRSSQGSFFVSQRQQLCTPFKACSVRARKIKCCKAISKIAASSERSVDEEVHAESRRGLLLAGALIAAPIFTDRANAEMETNKSVISVRGLSAFQRSAQRGFIAQRAEKELRKVLQTDDAPTSLRLLLHDAATYDAATGQGGVNGSIILSDELDKPNNKDLKGFVDKLASVKKAVDDKGKIAGQEAISWADLIVLAAKVAHVQLWTAAKVKRSSIAADGNLIAEAFGASFPVPLGRVDATTADPQVSVPSQSASAGEVKDFFSKLGKEKAGGFGSGKPPFWERISFVLWSAAQPDPAAAEATLAQDDEFSKWKKKYDQSRRTVTRTEYEVDFITYFTKLANLGAKFDSNKYLYPITLELPKIK